MTCLKIIPKTTTARLDYSVDWSAWLPAGAIITGFDFEVVGDPLLIVGAQSRVAGLCTAWLEGGTDGLTPELRCTLDGTNGPEVFSETRTVLIAVQLVRGTQC